MPRLRNICHLTRSHQDEEERKEQVGGAGEVLAQPSKPI